MQCSLSSLYRNNIQDPTRGTPKPTERLRRQTTALLTNCAIDCKGLIQPFHVVEKTQRLHSEGLPCLTCAVEIPIINARRRRSLKPAQSRRRECCRNPRRPMTRAAASTSRRYRSPSSTQESEDVEVEGQGFHAAMYKELPFSRTIKNSRMYVVDQNSKKHPIFSVKPEES
ncbi:hypothetical protein HBI41_256560 [Parastagonospora nodorum]|nr:hypothetical protein HBH71_254230 [Parastagonospora nodorum]KAH6243684.1 hypothetical protein HBI41_256560 [Parastagonospora nodorum]